MPSKTKQSEADKAREEAAKRTAALNEADATFREEVAKAAEKRDKARAKAGAPLSIAERAWDETKSDDDPLYRETALTHRQKLDDVVAAVRTSGNADVVGLEEFEARVVELLAEEGATPGAGGLVVADRAGRPTEEAAAAADKDASKKSK